MRFNRTTAQRKRIAVRHEIAAGMLLMADAKLLREAFDNYVNNAIKYTPPGGSVTVTCRPLPADGQIEFSVQDTGPGLSPEDQARLFRKFQKLTPRPTGGESSTGLGLSIVKTIAERHQGQVGCESVVGQGARFWLRLPARPPA
jgi:signal transduction histidine kinase